MKGADVTALLLFVFTLIIVLGPTLSGDVADWEVVTAVNPSGTDVQLAYDSHSSIVITKNSDFLAQGWPGSGTEGDPYVIENLDIRWSTCISISDTTVHFVIRNCYLWSFSTMRQDGVYLYNVEHATIEGCIIFDKVHGVYIDGTVGDPSINCTVFNNTIGAIVPCSYGIYLQHSDGCEISNNAIVYSSYYGIGK